MTTLSADADLGRNTYACALPDVKGGIISQRGNTAREAAEAVVWSAIKIKANIEKVEVIDESGRKRVFNVDLKPSIEVNEE